MKTNGKRWMAVRIAMLVLGTGYGAVSCASKTEGGTDSSTHWLDQCTKDADCGGLSCECGICTKPCGAASDCTKLSENAACAAVSGCSSGATVCLASTPMSGGTCSADVKSGAVCDGSVEQCWTTCAGGNMSQFVCSDGKWLAGKGLFPCGLQKDGGPTMDAGTHPSRDAGSRQSSGPCPSGAAVGVQCDGGLDWCFLPCPAGDTSSLQALYCETGSWKVHPGVFPSLCRGGTCSADVKSGAACDGSIEQCWTACAGGNKGQFVCSDGAWLAGHGLFPCGPDGGAAKDSGTSMVSTSCTKSADCYAADKVCCPRCDLQPTVSDKLGILRTSISAYNDEHCATAGACPPCVPPPGTIDSFCKAGTCDVEDLGKYKACTKDADCKLVPKDCCACGSLPLTAFVAISDEAGFVEERCATVDCSPPGGSCPSGVHVNDASKATCNTIYGYCEYAPQR